MDLINFLFQLYSLVPTPIPRIPTQIPRIPTLIPYIPIIPALISCISIIPLIPFPHSPFRVLQIAILLLQ